MIWELPQGGRPPCTPPGTGWTRAGGPSGSWQPRSPRVHRRLRRTRGRDHRPDRRRRCNDLGWFSCSLRNPSQVNIIVNNLSPFMLDTPTLSLELAQLWECFRLKESWWLPASLFLVLKLFNSFCHRDSRPSWKPKTLIFIFLNF